MADDNDQSAGNFFNRVHVGNLPYGVRAKDITNLFDQFGYIKNLYLKRRVSKDSTAYLAHPTVILVFDQSECVDYIMASRPFHMGDCQLFVRRCMPNSYKYPQEAFLTVRKILIRTVSGKNDEILPDDNSIVEYLASAGGKIEYFERLDNKTVLVQFDDYDPVDICCLSRPHFIKDQPVEIEKCSDEEQVRHRVEVQKYKKSFMILIFNLHLFRSSSISTELSPTLIPAHTDNQTMETASPTPILSVDDQIKQLRSTYNDLTNRFEREHEQLVTSLSTDWKQTAKERIRLQRLTLDYQQEHDRIAKENRTWQKLFSDSLREKPIVQTDGERKLTEACEKTATAKAKYEQLIQNIQQ
jgi:hypothetical protein